MSVEQYFDVISILIRVLILVAFALIFIYIVYCEREKITSAQKTAKEGEGEFSRKT
ncbi:MAG: hypothetical protein N3E47_06850 [Candidatus Bathyarchaeota archaeon]|nr:hypothetical protein [Candidatus Bathyarchaeota archaeon]